MSPTLRPMASSISENTSSPESRLREMGSKLREELKNSLSSEFLTQQIVDLERYFTDYITRPPASRDPLVFRFRDGYGRLICHGVAAYYHLVSASRNGSDGAREVTVSRPVSRCSAFKKSGNPASDHEAHSLQLPAMPLIQALTRKKSTSPTGQAPPLVSLGEAIVYTEANVQEAIIAAKADSISATERKKVRRTQRELQQLHIPKKR